MAGVGLCGPCSVSSRPRRDRTAQRFASEVRLAATVMGPRPAMTDARSGWLIIIITVVARARVGAAERQVGVAVPAVIWITCRGAGDRLRPEPIHIGSGKNKRPGSTCAGGGAANIEYGPAIEAGINPSTAAKAPQTAFINIRHPVSSQVSKRHSSSLCFGMKAAMLLGIMSDEAITSVEEMMLFSIVALSGSRSNASLNFHGPRSIFRATCRNSPGC